MTADTISLPDGRVLHTYVSGPRDGLPFVFHHGTPGSRVPFRGLERAVHERGMRVVTASRAGYGGSSRLGGRRVVDVVADTAAVLELLGATECVVAGHSGGGPHALACAARLPGVRAGLVIAGVAPHDATGLSFLDGMGEENLIEFGKAIEGEESLRPYLDEQRVGLSAATTAAVIESMATVLPDVDRAAMTDEFGDYVVTSTAEGLRAGVDGWVDDDLAFLAPWGFSLQEIHPPVTLWQGELDLMVPFTHGEWLAGAVPGVDAHLLTGEGHLSIVVGAVDRMLDALISLA